MRRMMFATFLIPGTRQYVELVHPYGRFRACGVTAIKASRYDPDGRELGSADLPLREILIDLATVFPVCRETALVLHDVTYDLKRNKHPYQYGFLYQGIAGATPIHYPLDVALGLTDAIRYSPNYGYFPLGPLPAWLGIRLYLGNVSEHVAIEPEVTLVTSQRTRRLTVPIPPLAHRVVDLDATEQGEAVEYLTVKGEQKPVCYVAGVDRRTGALTFLEHLMQTYKLDAEEGDQGNVPEPEYVKREASLRKR